jgi:hypothetical protein
MGHKGRSPKVQSMEERENNILQGSLQILKAHIFFSLQIVQKRQAGIIFHNWDNT